MSVVVMRILVTGGTGLVGKALDKVLSEEHNRHDSAEWFFVGTKEADLT